MVRSQDRKFVSADPEKCVGCVVCEYACSMTNDNTFNPSKSRIRALRLGPLNNIAVACRHCEDPACVAACPRDALRQEEDTGIIVVDEDACDGCRQKSSVHMQQLQRPGRRTSMRQMVP